MTEKKKIPKGLSRRDFLKDAGLLVGGTAIGSTVLLAACGGETTTETVTQTQTATVTSTVGAGQTATVTETLTASRFVCPIDGMEFDTLAELQAHFEAEHGGAVTGLTTLSVNGQMYALPVQPNWTLAFVLREKLNLTGTKVACDRGSCGCCSVLVDGDQFLACMMLAAECEGLNITTIEGLEINGELDPLQQAFVTNDAMQCGFCIPGAIIAAKSLLLAKQNPTKEEIDTVLSGVICRCGAYVKMVKAVMEVS